MHKAHTSHHKCVQILSVAIIPTRKYQHVPQLLSAKRISAQIYICFGGVLCSCELRACVFLANPYWFLNLTIRAYVNIRCGDCVSDDVMYAMLVCLSGDVTAMLIRASTTFTRVIFVAQVNRMSKRRCCCLHKFRWIRGCLMFELGSGNRINS